jgi:hypothetical protein
VVSMAVFPVFILCFELLFDPQSRFWLPATLLLIPLAVEGIANALAKRFGVGIVANHNPPAGIGSSREGAP